MAGHHSALILSSKITLVPLEGVRKRRLCNGLIESGTHDRAVAFFSIVSGVSHVNGPPPVALAELARGRASFPRPQDASRFHTWSSCRARDVLS